jgi:hypothetical protein
MCPEIPAFYFNYLHILIFIYIPLWYTKLQYFFETTKKKIILSSTRNTIIVVFLMESNYMFTQAILLRIPDGMRGLISRIFLPG